MGVFRQALRERTFFIERKRSGTAEFPESIVWKIHIGPDFIACYSDGGVYNLVSPDMIYRDLEEFLR
jgi:hypothetical protein